MRNQQIVPSPAEPSNAPRRDPPWAGLVPAPQLEVLRFVAEELSRAGVETLIGGAFAIARHVGRWRGTKDVDFFLRPADRDRAVAALIAAGFSDYHAQLEYDRSWIFRATRGDDLVDLIWTLPNHAAVVDESWFNHAARLHLQQREYAVVPLEELIQVKLFVFQRDRCDWPDVVNLMRCNARRIDWKRLLARMEAEEPLLNAAVRVLAWIAPATIADLPDWLRERFQLAETPLHADPRTESQRATLLDSRPWYAAILPQEELMGP